MRNTNEDKLQITTVEITIRALVENLKTKDKTEHVFQGIAADLLIIEGVRTVIMPNVFGIRNGALSPSSGAVLPIHTGRISLKYKN